MSDKNIKTWLARIFFFPMCCDFLIAIGKWISEDNSLSEIDKTLLRKHWNDTFQACVKAGLLTYEDADKMIDAKISDIFKEVSKQKKLA